MVLAGRDKRTVALIENDDLLREAIGLALDKERYEIVGYARADAALESFKGSTLPDVIVLDLRLPGMDGRMFRAAQRAQPRLRAIPVVVVSTMPESVRAIEADVHLAKPVGKEQLEAAKGQQGQKKITIDVFLVTPENAGKYYFPDSVF